MIDNKFVQKKCKSCGKIIDEKWDYCPYCRTKQVKIKCIFCKKDLSPIWNFCPYCKNKRNPDNRDKVLEDGNNWLNQILKK